MGTETIHIFLRFLKILEYSDNTFLFLHENIYCGSPRRVPTADVFMEKLEKNISTFWLKKVPYPELCIWK